MPSADLIPPFEAYKGDEPFVFVSYAHKNAITIFPEIEVLHQLGYRIWFDEGIDPGNEWPDEVAHALAKSALFLVYVSPEAVDSINVRNEINFALNRKKPFLASHIVETNLPLGLDLRMGGIQAIMRYRMKEDGYLRKLQNALPESLKAAPLQESKALLYPIAVRPEPLDIPVQSEFVATEPPATSEYTIEDSSAWDTEAGDTSASEATLPTDSKPEKAVAEASQESSILQNLYDGNKVSIQDGDYNSAENEPPIVSDLGPGKRGETKAADLPQSPQPPEPVDNNTRQGVVEPKPIKRRSKLGLALIIPAVLIITIVAMFPIFAHAREKARLQACQDNEKQIGLAILMYTEDYDEKLPIAATWGDGISVYLKTGTSGSPGTAYYCPDGKTNFGYAMNSAVNEVSLSEIATPAQQVAVFESDSPDIDTSGGSSIAALTRHTGGSDVCFVDSHVKFFDDSDIDGNAGVIWNFSAP